MKTNIIIYQGNKGEIALKGDITQETIWASQAQMVELFCVDQSVVSRHIKNIFKEGEIEEKSNMQKMHIANSDKPVVFYSLDVILSVGYRTNSKVTIDFRKWATKTLRQHIVKGYTINKKRITKNYDEFLQAVELVRKLLPSGDRVKAQDVLELVKMFANTWLSLDAYDKSAFPKSGSIKKQARLTSEELAEAIAELKRDLIKKKAATELFAQERQMDAISGIVGNVFQSVSGAMPTKRWKKKSHISCTFSSKNIPSPTATNEAELLRLCGF